MLSELIGRLATLDGPECRVDAPVQICADEPNGAVGQEVPTDFAQFFLDLQSFLRGDYIRMLRRHAPLTSTSIPMREFSLRQGR